MKQTYIKINNLWHNEKFVKNNKEENKKFTNHEALLLNLGEKTKENFLFSSLLFLTNFSLCHKLFILTYVCFILNFFIVGFIKNIPLFIKILNYLGYKFH